LGCQYVEESVNIKEKEINVLEYWRHCTIHDLLLCLSGLSMRLWYVL